MKLIGWAIALAAAGLAPAAAQGGQAAPQASEQGASPEAAPNMAAPQGAAAVAGPSDIQLDRDAVGTAASTPQPDETNSAAVQMTETGIAGALPDAAIGRPVGGRGLQTQVTEVGRYAAAFHDNWLLLLCAVVSAIVLILLCYAIVRFRRGANPTPSRTSHNTLVEVIWTVVPVLILVAIAIPSIKLLNKQYSPPPADLTIKVIGNQWYWTYQFPDHGGFEIVSNMLKEKADVTGNQRARTDADGPPLLAVDERLVIPAGKVVKFIVTSNDVIHAFWIPAFWNKIDANPGRLNEMWVKVDRPGVYFGQCTELCGARHAYMPIAVEVVPEAQFNAWVAAKGGTMPVPSGAGRPGAQAAAAPAPDSTAASPMSAASPEAQAAPAQTNAPAAAQPAAAQ